ncbi:MAG: flavohemoglobin expression-modulating QEGLA motif protein [Planctomycetota bacterium]
MDRRLAEIDNSFDLLLQATPVNAEAAWYEFKRNLFEKPPVYHYRPVTVEPALLKRRLYEVPIERIEDPTLAHIFREKQDQLDRRITMLADVGTPRFFAGSLQVYGSVDGPLLALATELLDLISPRSRGPSMGKQVSATAFAARAREEIGHYQAQYPEFTATVAVRDDFYSGLLVSQGHLLVGRRTKIPAGRVEALLQHEIGTHLVTYYNGRAQPFRQLASGLAGYDGLQEGLAVLSEYLVGGLSRPRLRLLATRVVAVRQLTQGAGFVETFRLLERVHHLSRRTAYTVTMRVYRAGGLTKDAIYLRGLVEILEYLERGGEIEPLLVGKIAADHVPLIRELRLRQVLDAPPLRPRYLDDPSTVQSLAQLRGGLSVLELLEGKRP